MKLPVHWIDIRVAIREDRLVTNFIPFPHTRCMAQCEVMDIGHIPVDVSAWISRLERRPETDPI